MALLCTTMKHFLSFFGILAFLLSFPGCSSGKIPGNETDRLALLEFKNHVKDPLGVLSSWNASLPFCQWQGVTCSRRHQRITALDLSSCKLAGPISPHVGNLSFLRQLLLPNNSFSQEIPSQLGRLSRLRYLDVGNNSLSGEIPANLSSCSSLVVLIFSWNKLAGQIPAELGTLTKLELLFVHANNLTGRIPPSFGNLSSLQMFSATQNNIGGSIPETLGRLAHLTHIAVATNNLSGKIPPSFFNLSFMVHFDLPYNQIQGDLPWNLGITLPNLQVLSLSSNQFTGSIPVTISNATKLEYIGLNANKLTGSVPSLEKLNRLSFLSMTSNHLGSGRSDDLDFLSSLANATNGLELLGLNDNNFGGKFPEFIVNFTSLSILFMDGNKISGSIPNGIGNLVRLERLELWENQMSGGIPDEIGNLHMLSTLILAVNRFSGNIPSSLGNLKMLTILALQMNHLQGSIPPSIGLCQNLLMMDLSRNNLRGSIPPEILNLPSLAILLDLSYNHLNGSLPEEVGNLKNLGILGVSENMLSGEIPTSLGSCTNLETLYMKGNLLEGSLPSSLSSLKGIQYLDLSRNNLSGELPKFLERFDLHYLNLSFNDFEGEVPRDGAFKNASAVSVIGNNKLCGGVPELRLQLCNTSVSIKKGRSFPKLKVTLSIVLGLSGFVLLFCVFLFCWLRNKKKEAQLNKSEELFLKVSYQTLLNATDGFSLANLIGEGSFGSVYKGIIDQTGGFVAIKVLNLLRRGASKSFLAECEALRNIRHRNLVKVLTACSGIDFRGNDFKALVYEFMSNGNLDKWLHPTSMTEEPRSLNLLQRLNISIDVADALEYLHNYCHPPVVHCDLKPSNILLDEEMIGHVSDFGLAKFLPIEMNNTSDNQSSSTGIRGTIGYAAPEYGMGTEVSTWGDVYSYGILLLEMFTGKGPTHDMFKDGLNLHGYVKDGLLARAVEIADPTLLQEGNGLTMLEDPQSSNGVYECLRSVFRVGVACSADLPRERMSIKDVAAELHSIRNKLVKTSRRGDPREVMINAS